MAKLFVNDTEIDIADGEKIVDAIEEAGVPIGCSNGVCGTCEVDVVSGMENLSEVNDEERDLGMEGCKRLGCQCTILHGEVKLKF
ncbi:(2Fe-2S)-binding protein [bacterium]|nr:(2Fe-2S)-binding protein [bacterium]